MADNTAVSRNPSRLTRFLALCGALLVALFGVIVAGLPSAEGAPATSSATTTSASQADDATDDDLQPVELIYFRGEGCSNCAGLEKWFEEELFVEFPNIQIVDYEVWHSAENREIFAEYGDRLGFQANSTPTLVLDERVWIGLSTAVQRDLRGAISMASKGESVPPGVYGSTTSGTCNADTLECTSAGGTVITIPLFGEVDLDEHSLLFSTLIIGFVDGINPCSLWVITILLTIVIRTGSRGRVIAIGSTFLLITAAMYALFMAGIYSVLGIMGHLVQIQFAVGLIALVFGIFATKDYFWPKRGPSMSIPQSSKPGLYARMRDVAGRKALIPALGATAVLAILVSFLETPCSAGLPVLWTGMLREAGIGGTTAVLYFIAYMIPFLLDEFIVFVFAVVTMRAAKMQEKHGQLLKLIAGVTMLMLALVMLLDPTIMEDPIKTLGLFVVAFAVAAIVHKTTELVKRRRLEEQASLSDDDHTSESPSEDETANT